jgi:hypothetical protein
MKKNSIIIAVVAIALGLIGGAVAYASIPGPDGVIHGCYKTSNPAQGALLAIDSAASCPSGYTALNWNQTGPAGPQGPAGTNGVSGYEVVSQNVSLPYNGGAVRTFHVDCPAGKVPLSGEWHLLPYPGPYAQGATAYSNGAYPDATGWNFVLGPPGDNSLTTTVDLFVVCAVMA